MNSSYYLYSAAAIVVIVLIGFVATKESVPAVYDEFAQCLADSGTKMFGAWWCPHCTSQKELFGKSFDKVNYIECSSPGSQSMIKFCKDAGIEGYPTWEFSDGSRLSGERSLEELGEKSGCEVGNEELSSES